MSVLLYRGMISEILRIFHRLTDLTAPVYREFRHISTENRRYNNIFRLKIIVVIEIFS